MIGLVSDERGSSYSQVRLYAKVADLLDQHVVKGYWTIQITPLVAWFVRAGIADTSFLAQEWEGTEMGAEKENEHP